MHPFARSVASAATGSGGVSSASRCIVALSGGPDSTALLLAWCEAADAGALPPLVGAAHFHHGLRGRDADEDAAFSAALCARCGVPCRIDLGVVAREQEEVGSRQSPHDTARRARYAFLEDAAREMGADVVATAHHADDQAETVLLRVLRGTGIDGLAAIPASRPLAAGVRVVRPLLGLTRAEIEDYCRARGVTARYDPSNDKRVYMRARARALLPRLAGEFNPRLGDALRRLAAAAASDADLIGGMVDALWDRCAVTAPGRVSLDASLAGEHPSLRRRVLLRALRAVAPDRENAASEASVLALEELLGSGDRAVDLPGEIRASRTGDRLVLERPVERPEPVPYSMTLPVPGCVWVPPARLFLRAEAGGEGTARARRALIVTIAYGTMKTGSEETLRVRAPRRGDRIAPLGMGGASRLVRDVMADAGWSAEARRVAPLVVRPETDEVLWIVGLAQAESTRIERRDQPRIRLSARWDC